LARSKEGTAGILIKGIDPRTAGQVTDLGKDMVYGELKLDSVFVEGERTLPGIVLGYNLADRLIVTIGDVVTIISPAGITNMMMQMPPMKQFRVTGYFETGLYEYDDTYAYISIPAAQELFKMDDMVSGIEIKLDDMNQAEHVADLIRDKIGYPYRVLSWVSLNPNLFAWMQIEKWAAFVILSLIIMVAAFNIISTLIMVVMEKTKEIGILKSMGATGKSIRQIFMFEGLVVGVVGTILGGVVGFALCWAQQTYKFFGLPSDVYIISWLPIYMKWLDFLMVGVAAIVISFIFSSYPASKAAKLDPVTAIRYE
jgi:lipoprotein-releasing system permease protein